MQRIAKTQGGKRMQRKQMIQHAVVTQNNIVQKIGKSTIYQPKIRYNGKGIKWFDDSKLLKKIHK